MGLDCSVKREKLGWKIHRNPLVKCLKGFERVVNAVSSVYSLRNILGREGKDIMRLKRFGEREYIVNGGEGKGNDSEKKLRNAGVNCVKGLEVVLIKVMNS